MRRISILPLLPGNKVGLISPAGPVKPQQVQSALSLLKAFQFDYEIAEHAFSDSGLVSATVDQRIADIEKFLRSDDIHALWCMRGGYGSIQLLDRLDFSAFTKNPKLFIGFSDLTALQWALFTRVNFPTVSGLSLTSQFSEENPFLRAALDIIGGKKQAIDAQELPLNEIRVHREGTAGGWLLGGTLSMMVSLCGTSFFPTLQDSVILFLEDVNEPLYRIDRYFQQLRLADFWGQVSGVILGSFLFERSELNIYPLLDRLISNEIPVVGHFPYGHKLESLPLPLGVPARLETSPFRLTWNLFE